MKNRPNFIGNYLDFIETDSSHYPESSELLSIGSPIGKKLGLTKIGLHVETLLPGRRTSWPHAESHEEEFVFVLEGNVDAWIDGKLHPLKKYDLVAFPSGTGITHVVINNSNEAALILVGGEKSKPENKIFYPLNPERNEKIKLQNRLWDFNYQASGDHKGMPTNFDYKNSRLILCELDKDDIKSQEIAQNILEKAPRYAFNISGQKVSSHAGEKTLTTLPDNFSNELKKVFAITLLNQGVHTPIGLIDILLGYPDENTLYLGLLLLDEAHEGQGHAKAAFNELLSYIKRYNKFNKIRLSVVESNSEVIPFWQKLGFINTGVTKPYQSGDFKSQILIFDKTL